MTAEVDVRGTLLVDRNVAAGFQSVMPRALLQPAPARTFGEVQVLPAAAAGMAAWSWRPSAKVSCRDARGGSLSEAAA